MSAIAYRASIDGMRAIAVVAVLLFHLDSRLLPGGFVGVDVFFVISGYLITSIIYSECQAGVFSFVRFYQRRIARIFPAFFLVSFAALAAASVLYSPQDYASVGATATAAALSLANVKFMLQGNYFEVSPDAVPLLHFWSLAVEEQFYIAFPLIIYLAFRLRLSRQRLMWLLGTAALASYIVCIALTASRPTWAFYLLPTRAWELLLGCILAIRPPNSEKKVGKGKVDACLGLLGLFLTVGSLLFIREGRSFPGFIAALPCIGAALLLGRSSSPQQLSERLLSLPWLVSIGKMSYSLYLWHWPVYCFVDYSMYSSPAPLRLSWKLALTIACSWACYKWFERPMRSYLNRPTARFAAFSSFALGVAAFVTIGVSIRSANYIDAAPDTVASGGLEFNPGVTNPVIVLMGDSNGSMYGKTMKEIAYQLDARAHVISVAGKDPFPNTELYRDSLAFIERERPDITVLAAAWADKIGRNTARLETALSQILKCSKHVIIVTQPPVLPPYASRQQIREHGSHVFTEDSDIAALRKQTNAYLRSLSSDRIHVLDIEPLFVGPGGEIRFADEFGRQLYHDKGHLSGFGSELVREQLVGVMAEIARLGSSVAFDKRGDN